MDRAVQYDDERERQRGRVRRRKETIGERDDSGGVKAKVLAAHKELARYVRVRKNRRDFVPVLSSDFVSDTEDRRRDDADDEENFRVEKDNGNDYVLTHSLLPKPRFLIGGASRRAMAALSEASVTSAGDATGVFEGRRKVPSARDLPEVPEIPERLKRMDVEYVTERKVIPVKPRIAPERTHGQKKSSSTGNESEEDNRNRAERSAYVAASEDSNAPTIKVMPEKIESEHRGEDDDNSKSINNGVSSEEQEQEHEEQQKPTPMQKAVLKAATYRLGGTKLKKLMDTEVDIFLSKSTLNGIDPEEKRNKITCGGKPVMQVKTYDQLRDAVPELSEYIPDEDDIHIRGGLRPYAKSLGRRCAVVGNSGSLLDHTYGSEIDSHDAVIRFNAAPTKGYEKHVGKKTTIRVQNIDNLGFREPKDEMLVFTARDEKTFRHFSEYQKKKYLKHKEKTHVQRAFNPEFWCHVWDWVDRRKLKPSSGFAGVVMALKACSGKVSLYGFSHNATEFHYFNHLDEKVTTQEVYQYHPLAEEAEAYRFLEFHKRLAKKE